MANIPTSNTLALGKDINGNVTYEIPWPLLVNNFTVDLPASTAKTVTVPVNVDTVFFSYESGASVWVNPVTTAALPTSTVASSYNNLNPLARPVYPGQTLSLISETNAAVQVSFYTKKAG